MILFAFSLFPLFLFLIFIYVLFCIIRTLFNISFWFNYYFFILSLCVLSKWLLLKLFYHFKWNVDEWRKITITEIGKGRLFSLFMVYLPFVLSTYIENSIRQWYNFCLHIFLKTQVEKTSLLKFKYLLHILITLCFILEVPSTHWM